eukprot:CAMPEP_0167756892 /NCGR_PEP_ID=MMETSP0110_2-20121227/9630_1 /TAXON_ID=629695 /ORGANISM="Gymnochlora sp., Strain CCMP2014" /LENGTH=485 /DNA_ID=CAMNT_0007643037 /DNA_START=59 /DNA_END=1513 /DNA_ORIENTATION=-
MSVADVKQPLDNSIIQQAKENLQKDVVYDFQLDEEREEILKNLPSDWEQQIEMGFTVGLSEGQISLLIDYEDRGNMKSKEDRVTMLTEVRDGKVNAQNLMATYISIIEKVNNVKIKKFFLASIDRAISEEVSCAKYINSLDEPYTAFLRILRFRASTDNDEAVMMQMFACRILSKLYSMLEKWYIISLAETKDGTRKVKTRIEDPLREFLLILAVMAKSKNSFIPLKALKDTLKLELSHELFSRENGIRILADLIEPGKNKEQVMYLAGFCIWMISFNKKMLRMINQSDSEEKAPGLIRNMVAAVRQVQREKVIRICFAAFRNMLQTDELKGRMVGLGLLDVIKTLNQTEDKELKANISKVGLELKKFLSHLSTFEKYTTEVMSGQLKRSAVHNEDFWRKNNAMFEHSSYKHIRKLVELLDKKHLETLEMACYDLGEFARFHPDGRTIISRLGGKSKVMRLMTHRNEAVAKQALLCIQKLMVENW